MEFSGPSRKPWFREEDDGLASLADMEAGFAGTHYRNHSQNGFLSTPFCFSRRSSLINLSSSSSSSSSSCLVSSPRSARFFDGRFEDPKPHFLDACFLCKKPLGANSDIFMYRGDIPFCSEECRQEQIDKDEAMEKNRNLCSSKKSLMKKDQRNSEDYPFRTGTVAAS